MPIRPAPATSGRIEEGMEPAELLGSGRMDGSRTGSSGERLVTLFAGLPVAALLLRCTIA